MTYLCHGFTGNDLNSNFVERIRGTAKAYYEHANQLAQRLLRGFAMALDLPEDWFVGKTDKHVSALRSNNYPDQANMVVPDGSIRCSAHTDYGTLTILKSGASQTARLNEEETLVIELVNDLTLTR